MKMELRNFLHRKPKENRSKSWYDISLAQFNQLTALGESATLADLLRIVYNKDLREIPISEITSYKLDFLKKPIPREPIKKSYTLNGTKYNATFELPSISTAQFFDFRNYSKNNDFVGVLSCCLIPEGHEYNDGYDSDKVREDIESLPITRAQTISFFFWNQTTVLLEAILQSSTSQLKKNPETKDNEELQKILGEIEKLDWNSLISSL